MKSYFVFQKEIRKEKEKNEKKTPSSDLRMFEIDFQLELCLPSRNEKTAKAISRERIELMAQRRKEDRKREKMCCRDRLSRIVCDVSPPTDVIVEKFRKCRLCVDAEIPLVNATSTGIGVLCLFASLFVTVNRLCVEMRHFTLRSFSTSFAF